MTEPQPIEARTLLERLPAPWPDDQLRPKIRRLRQRSGACVVALDDDPTGTQTVGGVTVLAASAVAEVLPLLRAGEAAVYVLTNSRSLPAAESGALMRRVASALQEASRAAERPLMVVSRSDSTLRGHFPDEVDALADALSALTGRPFDGLGLIPFFAEGGRLTLGDVHWVQEGEQLVPAAQTAYARDPVFGYRHSRLPEWIEEKTHGRIHAEDVASLPVEVLRQGGPAAAVDWLSHMPKGRTFIVNAAADRDLEVLAMAAHELADRGHQYLYRSAASWVKILAGLEDPPLVAPSLLLEPASRRGGLVICGSVVPRSNQQLEALHAQAGLVWVELPVRRILEARQRAESVAEVSRSLERALSSGHDAVLFTTRTENPPEDLGVGAAVSSALVQVVTGLSERPRYLLAKGGITASDIATQALAMRTARVLGPVLPGVSAWQMGPGSRWPGMAYIVFPGNVGGPESLAELVGALAR